MTFKVIQGQCFSSHLKECMLLHISDLGPISHHFQDMATYSLETLHWKLRQNCCRWRHGYYWQPIESCQHLIRWYHRQPPMTYYLATIPHNWITIMTLQDQKKVNDYHVIWKPICDFLLEINSNLGLILYCLATIRPRQMATDTETTDDNRNMTLTVIYVRSAKNYKKRIQMQVICTIKSRLPHFVPIKMTNQTMPIAKCLKLYWPLKTQPNTRKQMTICFNKQAILKYFT